MRDFAKARAGLIDKLLPEIRDKRVLRAIAHVPRELFVPDNYRQDAYEDCPLPIGFGQTISQPYIIACMTSALELSGTEKVLEIGTGSGYQTAILAELANKVISVERIPELLSSARTLLHKLAYRNVELHAAQDKLGWEKGMPYDAIMVTAGAPAIPDDLISQLAEGGRMVIPAGSRFIQELFKVTRDRNGIHTEKLGGCRFVALIGRDAWQN